MYKEAPIDPEWGVKKNSDGKNVFWFGYKAHLAVSTKSQYILAGLMTSGNLNDGKAAIPLLKKVGQDPYEAIRERAEVLISIKNGNYLFRREPRKNEIEIDFLKQ